jgi:hypothetical protein
MGVWRLDAFCDRLAKKRGLRNSRCLIPVLGCHKFNDILRKQSHNELRYSNQLNTSCRSKC